MVENPPGSLVVVTRPARLLQLERDGHVPDDGDHALAQPDPVGVLLERLLQPSLRQLIDLLQQCVDRAVVLDELGRGLVPDPWHARNVVRRVSPQGLEIDELRRLEAVALAHLVRPVDERVRDAAARH